MSSLVITTPLFAQSDIQFVEVSQQTGIVVEHLLGNICESPEMGSGSAWADYDNDGDVDLFITNRGGANYLFQNQGDTNGDNLPDFIDIAALAGVDQSNNAGHGAVFIDYDNDGDQDLFITNLGANGLFQNQLIESGNAIFRNATAGSGLRDIGRAVTAAWGDFDNDGFLDVYLAKHLPCSPNALIWNPDFADGIRDTREAEDRLFRNNGNGTFRNVTHLLCEDGQAPCPQVLGLGFSPGWVDFDNDGDLDLYLVNDNIHLLMQPNVFWRNDRFDSTSGKWQFTDISQLTETDINANGMGLAIGDYDNDGRFDFAFSNIGANYLLHNDNDTFFSNRSELAGIQRTRLAISDNPISVIWGTVFLDADNDCWLDLFIVAGFLPVFDNTFQPNIFFKNNRDGTFSDMSSASGLDHPGNGRNASIVDFDNDGLLDIFVGNLGEPPLLYHNRSTKNGGQANWLSITVEGAVSNRDGIGTRLELETANGLTQIREIGSGPTHGGGDYRMAHFGLAEFDRGHLTVRWPGGMVEDYGVVLAGQHLHLKEEGTAEPLDPLPVEFSLEQNCPNPFNGSTIINYTLPETGKITLKVYDMLGRRVKTLIDGLEGAGFKSIRWNATDEFNRPVGSGIYLYQIRAGNFIQSHKMLLIK